MVFFLGDNRHAPTFGTTADRFFFDHFVGGLPYPRLSFDFDSLEKNSCLDLVFFLSNVVVDCRSFSSVLGSIFPCQGGQRGYGLDNRHNREFDRHTSKYCFIGTATSLGNICQYGTFNLDGEIGIGGGST